MKFLDKCFHQGLTVMTSHFNHIQSALNQPDRLSISSSFVIDCFYFFAWDILVLLIWLLSTFKAQNMKPQLSMLTSYISRLKKSPRPEFSIHLIPMSCVRELLTTIRVIFTSCLFVELVVSDKRCFTSLLMASRECLVIYSCLFFSVCLDLKIDFILVLYALRSPFDLDRFPY